MTGKRKVWKVWPLFIPGDRRRLGPLRGRARVTIPMSPRRKQPSQGGDFLGPRGVRDGP